MKNYNRNDLAYLAGLLFLFSGITLEFSWGTALIVIGAIVTGIGIATSFYVTWLSSRTKK